MSILDLREFAYGSRNLYTFAIHKQTIDSIMVTENKNRKVSLSVWIAAVAVLVSAIVLGAYVYSGLKRVSMGERVVTVKGKAEIVVDADKGTMPIIYSLGNNNLQSLIAEADAKKAVVLDFLAKLGFSDKEIFIGNFSVREQDYQGAQYRYVGSQRITVISRQVAKIRELESRISELYSQGLLVERNHWDQTASYEVSDINSIKDKLIGESMKSAKKAGERFAADSQSKLGKMKTAWQGQIVIEDQDVTTPHVKTCRVVSTITYYLED